LREGDVERLDALPSGFVRRGDLDRFIGAEREGKGFPRFRRLFHWYGVSAHMGEEDEGFEDDSH